MEYFHQLQHFFFSIPFFFIKKYFLFAPARFGGFEGASEAEICFKINPSTSVLLWLNNPYDCKNVINRTLEGYTICFCLMSLLWFVFGFLPKMVLALVNRQSVYLRKQLPRSPEAIIKGNNTKGKNKTNEILVIFLYQLLELDSSCDDFVSLFQNKKAEIRAFIKERKERRNKES